MRHTSKTYSKILLPLTAWFMASIFCTYQYILRVLPSVTMDDTMERFKMDATLFGQFSGVYYLGYAGAQIPLGIMLDRIGPRKVLPFSLLLIPLGLTPFLFPGASWVLACIGRVCVGLGSAAAFLGIIKVIYMSFPEKQRNGMLSIAMSLALLGAIYGSQLLNYLFSALGWQNAFYLMIVSGVALGFLLYVFLPESEKDKSSSKKIWHELKSIWGDIKEVISTPQVFLICVCAGLMVGPLEGFADIWGTSFFTKVYGFEGAVSAGLPSLIFLGMCLGTPVLAFLTNKTKMYVETIIGCAFFMAMAFLAILWGKMSYAVLSGLLFMIGIASAYQILVFSQTVVSMKESLVSLATAVVNMVIMAFGYIFHAAIGKLMAGFGQVGLEAGVHFYSASTYTRSLLIIPIALVMGGLGFAYLRYFKTAPTKEPSSTIPQPV